LPNYQFYPTSSAIGGVEPHPTNNQAIGGVEPHPTNDQQIENAPSCQSQEVWRIFHLLIVKRFLL
jgi:hypothetical protein